MVPILAVTISYRIRANLRKIDINFPYQRYDGSHEQPPEGGKEPDMIGVIFCDFVSDKGVVDGLGHVWHVLQ